MTPGIYAMPAAAYHADPCPEPSLSAHDAQTLLTRSAQHCWHAHPRLNPDLEPDEPTSAQEEGTALHALLLERQDQVVQVEAMDWRTKAAQDARREARAAGRVALLAHRWQDLFGTAIALRLALARHEIGDFLARPGAAEQVMVWQEETEAGPLWCRSRVDWLCHDLPVLIDLKTTEGSADPEAWSRTALRDGLPLRVAHYLRGARAVGLPRAQHARYLLVVLERDRPFGVSVLELSPALLMMGEEQHEAARNLFAACLRDGDWPSYPPFVATIEAPNWLAYSHEDWKQRAAAVRERKPRPFAGQASALIGRQLRDDREVFG